MSAWRFVRQIRKNLNVRIRNGQQVPFECWIHFPYIILIATVDNTTYALYSKLMKRTSQRTITQPTLVLLFLVSPEQQLCTWNMIIGCFLSINQCVVFFGCFCWLALSPWKTATIKNPNVSYKTSSLKRAGITKYRKKNYL